MIILFKYCANVKNCENFRGFGYIYIYIYIQMIMMSLSLDWTCQRDRVSILVKFGLNKNNFI